LFVQLPFLILSVLLLVLGLATELAAALLDVELPFLTETMGISEHALQGILFAAAIGCALLGIVMLRLLPRNLAPMGAVGPHERHIAAPGHPELERVAHVNDPLQSVYVAVILIAGVLLVGAIS